MTNLDTLRRVWSISGFFVKSCICKIYYKSEREWHIPMKDERGITEIIVIIKNCNDVTTAKYVIICNFCIFFLFVPSLEIDSSR